MRVIKVEKRGRDPSCQEATQNGASLRHWIQNRRILCCATHVVRSKAKNIVHQSGARFEASNPRFNRSTLSLHASTCFEDAFSQNAVEMMRAFFLGEQDEAAPAQSGADSAPVGPPNMQLLIQTSVFVPGVI